MKRSSKAKVLRVWTNTAFKGVCPVGSCAVVVATTRVRAKKLLEAELTQCGLRQRVRVEDFDEVPTLHEGATVLLDGDY